MRIPLPLAAAVTLVSLPAWADWAILNKDTAAYEVKTRCGTATEDWWISGGVTKPSSIPEGNTCVVTMKKGTGSCTVKNNQTCIIKSGRLSKGGPRRT